ncbi:uncharacterized protein LODBEIA_P56280 [Lodderomyces beijingensis]|uniref:Glutaredoxin domain-containing protein n=1 Tax=Lodderomyces beijingensis TaxID=1775926 RepID=A0ABP0ZU35_9ASCO
MAGVRHLRIAGLTGLVLILLFVVHRVGQNAAAMVHAQVGDQIGNKIHAVSPSDGSVGGGGGGSGGSVGGVGGGGGDKIGVTSSDKKSPVVVANNLVNSLNDEKTDDAINKEISKGKSEEGVKKIDGEGGAKSAQNGEQQSSNNQKTTDENGEYDPAAELIKIRSLSPMTIFSKSYCPYSKKLKKLLLEKYEILPAPNVVELDFHEHGTELQNYLLEKSGRRTVPNVLVGQSFESRGGADDFEEYHRKGEIISVLTDWGQGRIQVVKKDTPSNA